MSFTGAQVEAGERALTDLDKARSGVRLDVQTSWDWSDGTAKDAALNYLEKIAPNAIASLRRRLDAGGDWARWVADATQLYKDIQDVGGYTGEWSFTGVLLSVGRETAGDIGKGAKQVADAARSGSTWGVAAFVLLALVWWKVS